MNCQLSRSFCALSRSRQSRYSRADIIVILLHRWLHTATAISDHPQKSGLVPR
jgi:hypothetical protein